MTFVIRHSIRPPAERSDPSSLALEADCHSIALDDHRYFADPFGVLQHVVHLIGFFNNVAVIKLPAVFGKCFTSCPGVRSGVFSVNQDLFSHLLYLLQFTLRLHKSIQTSITILRQIVAIKRPMLDSGYSILDNLHNTLGGATNIERPATRIEHQPVTAWFSLRTSKVTFHFASKNRFIIEFSPDQPKSINGFALRRVIEPRKAIGR